MIYGYARVSTSTQERTGNSLESQQQALKEHGANKIYIDSFTGTKMERPEFEKLLKELKNGDTLIVTKLDRFARSVTQASDLITDLIDRGITVNVLNLGILSNDSVSTLIRNILLSFAQFERDMIVERTQEGKAIAKQKSDFREGRPKKFAKGLIDTAINDLSNMSYNQVSDKYGISKSTLIREVRRRKALSK